MTFTERIKKVVRFLASTELAVALFLVISLVAIPGTFSENRALYSSPPFLLLLGLFGMNLLLCTQRRFATISKPVLVLHGGVLATLLGCILASFGFVATVTMYEGTLVDHVYRWDREMDGPLGAGMALKKINWEFYPMPVRIRVLKGQNKEGLFELKTGQGFDYNGYRISVGPVEFNSDNLKLSIFEKDRLLGTFDTLSGVTDLPPDFPYSFKLVATKTPKLKRQWVELALTGCLRNGCRGDRRGERPVSMERALFFQHPGCSGPCRCPLCRDPDRTGSGKMAGIFGDGDSCHRSLHGIIQEMVWG